jgi:hypothetical protein
MHCSIPPTRLLIALSSLSDMTDPSADGMVQCCACSRQTMADKGGRMRPVCMADRSRPSLVQGARIAAKFAERGREPLRAIAIWPKKRKAA